MTTPSNGSPFVGACSDGKDLAELGLGRGINGAHPNRPLGDVLICPHSTNGKPLNVEVVQPWIKYSQFLTNVWSESKMTREFRASLDADFFKPLTVNFQFGIERARYNKRALIATGHQIHTRTFRFDINSIQNCKSKSDCPAADSLIDQHLKKVVTHYGGDYDHPETIDPGKREEWALETIQKHCQGFTHFVAAIHKGGKVFYKQTTNLVNDTDVIEMGLTGNAAGLLKANVKFENSSIEKTEQNGHEVIRMIHPSLGPLTGPTTEIPPEKEALISYEVLPVASLLHNAMWREAVDVACQSYVEDEIAGKEEPALIDTDYPLYLKAGGVYLRLEDDCETIAGTTEKSKATPVHIDVQNADSSSDSPDPLDAVDVPFHMAFKTKQGVLLYFAADKKNEKLELIDLVKEPSRGQLHLVHPASGEGVSLSKWAVTEEKTCAIATKVGLLNRYHYLVIDEKTPDFHASFSGDPSVANRKLIHQFKIVNGRRT
eukprot:m.306000 g.306000  ORF g.306000 m.306000 type:complete len:488 (+) comp40885_c0_seq1:185-1648(+)